MEMGEGDLQLNYQSFCDPRLNYEQSLDMAFLIAKILEDQRKTPRDPHDSSQAASQTSSEAAAQGASANGVAASSSKKRKEVTS